MFPCSSNTPGFSGTDKKHRKAFLKWRDWQKDGAYSYESEIRQGKRHGVFDLEYREGRLSRLLIRIVGIPLVLAALLGLGVLLYGIGDSYVESQILAGIPPTIIELERDDAYNFYHKIGRQWLAAGDMEEARVNFGKALEIAPYGQNARFALTKILEGMCKEKGLYCEESKVQRDFINGMEWTEEELVSAPSSVSSN